MALAGSGTPEQVRTIFNYTKQLDVPPEQYYYEDEKARFVQSPGDDPRAMTVFNGWPRVDSFSLDREGFCLRSLKSGFTSWEDGDQVRQDFYPEIVQFLKDTTGASSVLVFDHTIRTARNMTKKLTHEDDTAQRAPLLYVHCDYTADSGPMRVRQLIQEPGQADALLSRRVVFINVWKPISTVEERPLGMCDTTTVAEDDYFKLVLRYRDRTGENYLLKHSPRHRWWYFPNMTPEQLVLLKTYDSATDGTARFVGHSAFEDPTSSADAAPRESMEIRTIAFF